MPSSIPGLHHVTAIASDPQRNLDFYTEVIGLRLVKRTVNFDDPETYHFYFGNDTGTPGTILTFFPWPGANRGNPGTGETSATAFRAPADSLEFWERRLLSFGIPAERAPERFGEPVLRFADPDGMRLEIVAQNHRGEFNVPRTSNVPAEHAIRGFHSVTLAQRVLEPTAKVLETMGYRKIAESENRTRFAANGNAIGNYIDLLVQPQTARGFLGAGSVHHIAFRADDDSAQLEWKDRLSEFPLHVTPVQDRIYFHSIYFREPGGVLFEIATDPPGFTLDEPVEALGESLKLPAWLESRRTHLERALPAIELPHRRAEVSHE